MAITRKSLADTIDEYDAQIAELQAGKRETYQSYREELSAVMGKDAVKSEIEAFKAALKRRQAVASKGAEAIEEKDVLVDEIFAEIGGTVVATQVTRGARGDRDARRRQRFSESMDDAKSLSAEATALGLIDPEAHAETVRLANALAGKFGDRPLPDHDPETGEIYEPASLPDRKIDEAKPGVADLVDTPSTAARKDVQRQIDVKSPHPVGEIHPARERGAGTQDPPVDTHSATAVYASVAADGREGGDDATALLATHPVANVGEGANGAIAAAPVDPASRETDDADRQQLVASGFAGDGEHGSQDPQPAGGDHAPLQEGSEPAEVPLSIERLRSLISYNPITGSLRWEVDCGRARVGQEAGKIDRKGYRSVQIDGTLYQGHVLAWAIVNGEWPDHLIDHRDRNGGNNAWDNLRAATFATNAQNASLRSDSTSGFKGVSWHGQKGKWRAEIQADGVSHYLGLFTDPAEAARAYDRAAVELHGEFAFLNFPESTAPRSDVGDNTTEASGHGQRLDPAAGTTLPAGGSSPVDTSTQPQGDSGTEAEEATVEGGSAGGENVAAPSKTGERDALSPAPSSVVSFARKPHNGPVSSTGLPRPIGCQNLDTCAGTWRQRCHSCERAFVATQSEGVQIA